MQTSITPRREAEAPKYHLAATNGLEPIQATEAWRTARQEETGTANIQGSHSEGTGDGLNRKVRRLQSGAQHWVSEEKVLEVNGGTQFLHKYVGPQVAHRCIHGWCGRGGGSPVGRASLTRAARSRKAHQIRRRHSFSSQVGTQL